MNAKHLKLIVPTRVRRWLRYCERWGLRQLLPFRRVRDSRRLWSITPVDRQFGWTRGTPIDRYYIEHYLASQKDRIQGSVLEFQSDLYTRRFGGRRVTQSSIIDISRDNPRATIVTDIANPNDIPSDQYDCILCTQVLLLVYDLESAIRNLHRLLKKGGVLFVTVPGIAHKQLLNEGLPDYWRFTPRSAQRLHELAFEAEAIEVRTYGNVLAATAFLHGVAAEELRPLEVAFNDPEYPVTIVVKAVK